MHPGHALPRWLAPALLVASGAALAVGGVLHPHVPDAEAEQMLTAAEHSLWAPAHWLLTLAQAGALVALLVVLAAGAPALAHPLTRAGLAAAAAGLLLGVIGTGVAASGLATAGAVGQPELFRVVAHFDLAIGWMCLVLASAGGILAGAGIVRAATSGAGRAFGWTVLAGSGVLLAAAIAVPPLHVWTHRYVLRIGVVALGAALVAGGAAWARSAPR